MTRIEVVAMAQAEQELAEEENGHGDVVQNNQGETRQRCHLPH